MHEKPDKSVEQVIREDGRYPPDAYALLQEGLQRAVRNIHGQEAGAIGPQHHVSGQQMCMGLRDVAVERWGMLAKCVLNKWNIRATIDFGNMVYLLIRHGHMGKTDEDSIEDFRDVFDFHEAFDVPSEFELKE